MRSRIHTLALYTTVYPGVEAFLADWYRSVRRQSDSDFSVWIGSDGLEPRAVMEAMGGDPRATWVPGSAGDTPAAVRQRALARLVDCFDAVILVDSDDILHPERVSGARMALAESDLVGCSLRFVDVEGQELPGSLALPPGRTPEDVLPRNNVYGLSNSAYTSALLRRCLPVPPGVELVDWFLATRAWLIGAQLGFDQEARMDYRQHVGNMARVRPPFTERQVVEDTAAVCSHFETLNDALPAGARPDRCRRLSLVAADIGAFTRKVAESPRVLATYVHALNGLDLAPLWWSCVAHPSLRWIWDPDKEE
jgi:hypothetical protein